MECPKNCMGSKIRPHMKRVSLETEVKSGKNAGDRQGFFGEHNAQRFLNGTDCDEHFVGGWGSVATSMIVKNRGTHTMLAFEYVLLRLLNCMSVLHFWK